VKIPHLNWIHVLHYLKTHASYVYTTRYLTKGQCGDYLYASISFVGRCLATIATQ